MRMSVVIPTYERPLGLYRCLNSLISQTRKPHEILIIDDGNLLEMPLEEEIKRSGIDYIYLKKMDKGVAASRNLGAQMATGDVVFFLEDDVVIFPDFIEEIMGVYESPLQAGLGGVGGVMANLNRSSLKDFALEAVSYIFLHRSFRPARILPSGFDTFDFHHKRFKADKFYQVDYIPGGIGSFTKAVVEEFPFSTDFQNVSGYGQGQDREFGYRVSRKYRLYINPRAKAYHFPGAKLGGGNKRKKGKDFVLSRYLFFTKYLSYRRSRWPLFCYSLLGYFLLRSIAAAMMMNRSEFDRVRGILDAVKLIRAGKVKYNK